MTKLDSIPESQLTALMDLILETAADLEEQKKRSAAPTKLPTLKMAHRSHLHFSKLNTKKPN